MRLALHELRSIHTALKGHPIDLAKYGGLALQRAGHVSPVRAEIDHDGVETTGEIEWLIQSMAVLDVLDSHRITEDGAEAIALTYVSCKAAWVVKRRLQRGESADWLLRNESGWLALEVSGTTAGDPYVRLQEKKQQAAHCSLPASRLAVVVAFGGPSILAGNV